LAQNKWVISVRLITIQPPLPHKRKADQLVTGLPFLRFGVPVILSPVVYLSLGQSGAYCQPRSKNVQTTIAFYISIFTYYITDS